jgi:mRNA-degrading endonuclease toxin of MazEF toxin-antitoxin module
LYLDILQEGLWVPIQFGSIIWVRLADPNGVNVKPRPAVVLTPDDLISTGAPIVVAAVTTSLPNALTNEYVELPWHPAGAVKTGLRQRCAVHCGWLAEVDPKDVERISGFAPGPKLQEIARKTAAFKTPAEDAE